jgi:hypothetical protein
MKMKVKAQKRSRKRVPKIGGRTGKHIGRFVEGVDVLVNGKNSGTDLGRRARQLDTPNVTRLDNQKPSTATALQVLLNPRAEDNMKPSERRAKAQRDAIIEQERLRREQQQQQHISSLNDSRDQVSGQAQTYMNELRQKAFIAEDEGRDEDQTRYLQLLRQAQLEHAEYLKMHEKSVQLSGGAYRIMHIRC